MKNIKDALTENYCCAKCRNRSGTVKKVHLPRSSFPDLFGITGGRYLFLTCTLCGYTEMFDLAVYARSRETGKEEADAVQEA
jgi:predicted nucleic-acid-binding Zn-ribbon protein